MASTHSGHVTLFHSKQQEAVGFQSLEARGVAFLLLSCMRRVPAGLGTRCCLHHSQLPVSQMWFPRCCLPVASKVPLLFSCLPLVTQLFPSCIPIVLPLPSTCLPQLHRRMASNRLPLLSQLPDVSLSNLKPSYWLAKLG